MVHSLGVCCNGMSPCGFGLWKIDSLDSQQPIAPHKLGAESCYEEMALEGSHLLHPNLMGTGPVRILDPVQ